MTVNVLLGSLRPVALDSLRGISSLHFFDARGHSRSFACLPSLHFLIRLEHYNTNMGVLSDCHVQVKRILTDDDFVKRRVFDRGGERGWRSTRAGVFVSLHSPPPSFVKISNVQHFTVMNDYPQQRRKLRGINHLIPAKVLP